MKTKKIIIAIKKANASMKVRYISLFNSNADSEQSCRKHKTC